jgi:hypothetical protein
VSGPGTVGFANPASPTTTATFSTNGTYVLRLTADDSAIQRSDDITVTVLPEGSVVPRVIDVAVSKSADDAEERPTGRVKLGSTDLQMVVDGSATQVVGLRFAGLALPKNATIVNAYVQFRTDEATTAGASLTIQAQAADNPVSFTTATGNISTRPRTQTSVAWSPAPWPTVNDASAAERTPNLASLIQASVDRAGWSSGNAIVLIVTGTGTRTADSFNGGWAPILHVEYVTS